MSSPEPVKWTGKQALVTGAGGFIGSHLVERLVELGADVRAFVHYHASGSWGWLDHGSVRDALEVISGDICDRDSVVQAMQGVDVVFHLAALIAIPYSYHTPGSFVQTNVGGTLNVLQAARACGVERVVHTSTSEVYGTAQFVPITEQHPLQAQSPYAATKIGADKLAESFCLSYGLPVVTVRPFNTYGPRQSSRAIIPTIITQALADGVIRLGNLTPTRDLNYVTDIVEGFVRAASVSEAIGRTFHFGSGREMCIRDLVSLIGSLTGLSLRIEQGEERIRPESSEVERLVADATQAQAVLGWQPSMTLEDGLQMTIQWMREHLDLYRPGAYVL